MDPRDQRASTRVTSALMLAQSLSSAAYSTSIAINQLAVVDMTGQRTLGGLPTAVILSGSALLAYGAGRAIPRFGRRIVLSIGALMGGVGALLAGAGILAWTLPGLIFGLFVLGMGRGVLDHSRYTAGEINPPERRARALSYVVWGGTVGGVAGPLLSPWLSGLGVSLGWNQYAGPLFGTGLLYVISSAVIFVLLAVDLKGMAERVAAQSPKAGAPPATSNRSFGQVLRESPGARVAAVAMTAGQASMALMMSCISIHMKDHGHPLWDISIVTSVHIMGMFALSPLVGQLSDRIGRRAVIMIGALIAITGSLLVPVSLDTPVIAVAEFMVGLGWSGCFVAGSALLTDALGIAERSRLQGTNDAFVNIGTAMGSLGSGPLLQLVGIWPLAAVGVLIFSLPLLFAFRVLGPGGGAARPVPKAAR
jgi:MFS family permease